MWDKANNGSHIDQPCQKDHQKLILLTVKMYIRKTTTAEQLLVPANTVVGKQRHEGHTADHHHLKHRQGSMKGKKRLNN